MRVIRPVRPVTGCRRDGTDGPERTPLHRVGPLDGRDGPAGYSVPCCEMERHLGLLIVGLGLVAVVIGLLVWAGAFSWFGRLPGDIRVERENTRFYLPITSMILVSIVASVLLTVVGSLLRR
jgi:hypothetical protein